MMKNIGTNEVENYEWHQPALFRVQQEIEQG